MNHIQMISQQIESERLKLQMGLSPDVDIDTLTLRAMWHRLCAEEKAAQNRTGRAQGALSHPTA